MSNYEPPIRLDNIPADLHNKAAEEIYAVEVEGETPARRGARIQTGPRSGYAVKKISWRFVVVFVQERDGWRACWAGSMQNVDKAFRR